MKAKGHHFEHLLNLNILLSEPACYTTCSSQKHQQFSMENMLTLCIIFHHCYLKGYKVSKGKGQGKLNRHIIFESVLMLFVKNYQN